MTDTELCRAFLELSTRGLIRRTRVYRAILFCTRPTGHKGPHSNHEMTWGELGSTGRAQNPRAADDD